MDTVNVCNTLQLCHGSLTFLTTAALPPSLFDINCEASHIAFLDYMAEFIGSIPPPPPAGAQFNYLKNVCPLQPAIYHRMVPITIQMYIFTHT